MKKHFGWTVYGILGYIFAPMGALFAAIGLFVGQSLNARWQSPEDPVIFRAIFCGVGGIFLLLGLAFSCLSTCAAGISWGGPTAAVTVWTRRSSAWSLKRT